MNYSKAVSLTTIDWKSLFSPLMILILSLIISAGMIWASQEYDKVMAQWEREQRRQLGDVQAKYLRLQETLEIVETGYFNTFNQLTEKGFFINIPQLTLPEQRLKMINEIKKLLSQLPLFKANYDLSETIHYKAPENFIIEPELKTYQTALTLTLDILHEADVLELIQAIEFQQFTGLFNWHSCHIQRISETIDLKNASQPYFNATCVLVWYISKIENQS
jgi:hypothetical protein